MKALILNSGTGTRMGVLTSEHPKCMTEITSNQTIISRQLIYLADAGIKEVIVTTGYYEEVLISYIQSLELPISVKYVHNPLFDKTNYIYSIYCAREYLDDDIILMHGDLVFDSSVLESVVNSKESCMTVSSTLALPEKDFKAVIHNNRIEKVGIEFFDSALAAQPLYKLNRNDWLVWLNQIKSYCESDRRKCYAENAFNEVSDKCLIRPLDVKDELCAEIDNAEDLERIKNILIEEGKKCKEKVMKR